MATMEIYIWKGLFLALFFLVDGLVSHSPADKRSSGPLFLVTLPGVIESGSDAKLCASLLKSQESLTMSFYLLDGKNQSTNLGQKSFASKDFHGCFRFKAPVVDADSVQQLKLVVQGRSFKMIQESNVMFRSYLPVTFIQTDKPLYNPGQTVNFRIVTMDITFVPLEQMYSLVAVEDNNGLRINQWLNVSSTNWILELSHDLNPEAQVGTYTLMAFIGDQMTSQVFDVKEYVLPKFEVTISAPAVYSVGSLKLKIAVCGNYTYGQPVPGQVFVEMCREPFPYITDPTVTSLCVNKTARTNAKGCASITFIMSAFFNSNFENSLQDALQINASLTEDGTGVVLSTSQTVSITFQVGSVAFVSLPQFFAYGSVINGKILASYYNNTPIPNRVVYLLNGNQWPNEIIMNLTTNQKGEAAFSLNTSTFPNAALNLVASATPQVSYEYNSPFFNSDTRVVQLLQPASPDTPTYSQLTIVTLDQPLKCGSKYTVTIQYSFVGESGDYSADIVYMVLSKGVISFHGFQKVFARSSDPITSGTVMFKLSVSVSMAPVVQIVTYCILPSLNVVAGSASFNTEPCFQNQVSLQFSPSSAVPGERNILTVSAQAGSICGLSAIDESVLILEPGRQMTAQTIYALLPTQAQTGYPPGVEDAQPCLNVRPRRAVPTDEAYNTFQSVGLKVLTNLPVQEPQCLTYRGLNYYRNVIFHPGIMVLDAMAPAPVALSRAEAVGSSPEVTIRTYFPETWIWQLAQVGNSGSTSLNFTVPGTITTWQAEAFCLSSKGLGLAPPASLTSFQPFFVELTLPYSIVRGEFFELKATVFNYMSKCIMVNVTSQPSSAFSLGLYHEPYSSCLCANARKTFKWIFIPSALGNVNVTVSAQAQQSSTKCRGKVVTVPSRGQIDEVTQSVLVLAEGVQNSFIESWLLCPGGGVLFENVNIVFPSNMIQGSDRCSISVLGDIMGRALKNLAQLLQMPSGCGEQNMIILAPNIYILRYLEVTSQLTAAIRAQAIVYLQSGYQGELNYRHSDGSFSTFGYDPSNTWLTTFVMKSFALAQRYIYIDPNVLQSAHDWLISKQGSDGCFTQQGTMYHADMKGGVGDNVTMTAYIVAALLELGVSATNPVIINGLSCLRPNIGNLENTYATALLAYTFSLAQDYQSRAQLFNALNSVAISEGNELHWAQSSDDTLAVEISSYVLLAVLTQQSVSTTDLGYANRIVSWIVRQQNPYGGFTTTQDTVVALQALSLYATHVFSVSGSSTVAMVSVTPGEVHLFSVTPDNRLLYQEEELSTIPGNYTVGARGTACVSVQVGCFYNVPAFTSSSGTLNVVATVSGTCNTQGASLLLNITVSYNGSNPSTNMAIVDVKILSGFTADTTLLGSSPNTFAPLVQRVDTENDHVIVYLEAIPKGLPMTYSLRLNRVLTVQNLKPAVIQVYDYYQTSDSAETSYKSPC